MTCRNRGSSEANGRACTAWHYHFRRRTTVGYSGSQSCAVPANRPAIVRRFRLGSRLRILVTQTASASSTTTRQIALMTFSQCLCAGVRLRTTRRLRPVVKIIACCGIW